jgi:hypothetical protein
LLLFATVIIVFILENGVFLSFKITWVIIFAKGGKKKRKELGYKTKVEKRRTIQQ